MVGVGGFGFGDVWALSLGGTPTWARLVPGGPGPGARGSASAIYDPVRDRVVVFGGGATNDVWALSLGGAPAWTRLTPAGAPPSARGAHSAIYDPARDCMVVFGGYDRTTSFDDVWALSLGTTPAWTQLAPVGAPPAARCAHSAIYDPVRDRMVIFGGWNTWNGSTYHADIWTLSLGDTPAWTQLAPSGATPDARFGQVAVYDPAGDAMVVFGGRRAAFPRNLGEVWTLSLGDTPAWIQLAPGGPGPGARYLNAAAYDPLRCRLIEFGGYNSIDDPTRDVWALTLGATPAWANLTPVAPTARYGHTAVYDPVGDRMVVYGGYDESTPRLNDVWTLSLSGQPQWSQLAPVGTPPDARFRHSAIYDPVRGRMIVFGGYGGSRYDYTGPHFGDVWALSLNGPPAWTQLSPAEAQPAARQLHSAIYDPLGDRMIVYGGRDGTTACYDDVWALSLGDPPAWTRLSPAGTSPGGQRAHTAVYAPTPPRMVVFGGTVKGVSYPTNDTWTLSLDGTPTWTKLEPAGKAAGLKRAGHVAIYDPVRDRMIVYGGGYAWGGMDYTIDPWALSLGQAPAWTELSPTGEEVVQEFIEPASAVYDPLRDRMLVFGGACLQCGMVFDGTYALTWASGAVPVQLALVSAQADPGRVVLNWYAAAGAGVVATVSRRTAETDWVSLGEITAAGTGQLIYEDRAVVPGTRYGYRLGLRENGVETFVGEAWVDVPLALELALAGAQPNPAMSELAVAFTLPDATPARLEAFDLAGRRVATMDVGALGAGRQLVRLGEGRVLGCGVYLVRLTRGGRALTTRAVIVR